MGLPDFTTQSGAVWKGNVDAAAGLYGLGDPVFFAPLRAGIAPLIGVGAGIFARSTTGTYVGIDGIVRTAAIDVARFEAGGYLSEGASTNLALRSEEFDNGAVWVPTGTLVITANSATAPDGTNTADTLDDQDTDIFEALLDQSITVADDSATYTFSLYVKQGTAAKTRFGLRFTGGSVVNIEKELDWSDLSAFAGTVLQLDNGWIRVSFSASNNSSGNTTLIFRIGPAAFGATDVGTIFAWGAQLEKSIPFASSYIPTTVSAVTRNADSLTYDVQNLPLLNGDQTWFCNVTLLGFAAAADQVAMGARGDVTRRITANDFTGNVAQIVFGFSAVDGNVMVPGVSQRLAARKDVAGDAQEIWQDGVNTGSDVLGGLQTGPATFVDVGHGGLASHLFGNIRDIRLYNNALNEGGMFRLGAQ